MRRLVLALLACLLVPVLVAGRSSSPPVSVTARTVEGVDGRYGVPAPLDLGDGVAPDTTPVPPTPQEALRVAYSEIPPYGAFGPSVVAFQVALAGAGFDPGPVDGGFGSLTAAAARAAGYVVAIPVAPAPVAGSCCGPHTDAWWSGVAMCEQGGNNHPYFGFFSFMDGSQGGKPWADQVAAGNALLAWAGREIGPWAASCVAAGYRASPDG